VQIPDDPSSNRNKTLDYARPDVLRRKHRFNHWVSRIAVFHLLSSSPALFHFGILTDLALVIIFPVFVLISFAERHGILDGISNKFVVAIIITALSIHSLIWGLIISFAVFYLSGWPIRSKHSDSRTDR
jgi:hypothetical protein